MRQLLEAAELVRTRADGWESAWDQLVTEVASAIAAKIRRDFPSLAVDVRDDLAQDLLTRYHERATGGTLLERWDGLRSPVGFLAGDVVHKRVLDWLEHAAQTSNKSMSISSDDHDSSPIFQLMASDVAHPEPERHRDQAQVADLLTPPWELAPPPTGQLTRDYRTAGAELYLRLTWTHPVSRQLHAEMPDFLSNLPRDDWEAALKSRIEARMAALEERCASAEIHLRSGTKTEARIARSVLAKAVFQLQVCPLEPDDLRAMTGVTSANAQQLASSYRRALPDLVPALAQAWLVMQRLHRTREGVA